MSRHAFVGCVTSLLILAGVALLMIYPVGRLPGYIRGELPSAQQKDPDGARPNGHPHLEPSPVRPG